MSSSGRSPLPTVNERDAEQVGSTTGRASVRGRRRGGGGCLRGARPLREGIVGRFVRGKGGGSEVGLWGKGGLRGSGVLFVRGKEGLRRLWVVL